MFDACMHACMNEPNAYVDLHRVDNTTGQISSSRVRTHNLSAWVNYFITLCLSFHI